ncbi:MAG: WD40 repeat domain-containing protein [Candidatus Lokiarchaeota archaeon]|nr:WD40 repeat domain-containing protein [Candidatus Lokiarchaeota archaeon]
MSKIKKRFNLKWMFEAPEAVLTYSNLKCGEKRFFVFGGHDRTLYLMDDKMQILDSVTFDGWCRCSYPVDITSDGCDEILVGAGDGNFLVLKFVKGLNKLATIMNYRSSGKVLCVTAGDLTNDGNIELIHCGEDKTVKIFENIDATSPKYVLYYDSWVTSCASGCLKLSNLKDPLQGLIIGTKNGMLQMIQIKDGSPDIIWQRQLGSQINAIDIGDVINNGYNDIIVGSDDSIVKIYNADGEELNNIEIEGGRPISVKVADIDGDNAKEIIVGSADGTLRIYHNQQIDSTNFELKWKTNTTNSIKIVSPIMDDEQGLINIIFGGYDRSLRCVSDFEWGEKPKLDVPDKMGTIKSEKPKVVEEELEQPIVKKTVPTNLRDYIFKILDETRVVDGVIKELQKIGYLKENIKNEFELMKSQKPGTYEKVSYSLWSLSEEDIGPGGVIQEPRAAAKIKTEIVEEVVSKGGDLIRALQKEKAPGLSEEQLKIDENLRYIIIHNLEKNKVIPTRTKLITEITILGYSESDVDEQVDLLKEHGVIQYSKSNPKGWRLTPQ